MNCNYCNRPMRWNGDWSTDEEGCICSLWTCDYTDCEVIDIVVTIATEGSDSI